MWKEGWGYLVIHLPQVLLGLKDSKVDEQDQMYGFLLFQFQMEQDYLLLLIEFQNGSISNSMSFVFVFFFVF